MPAKISLNDVIQLVLTEVLKITKKEKIPIKKSNNIYLTGDKTEFDSVALITLISSLEKIIKNKTKKNIVIADNEILNNLKIIKDTNSLSKHIYKKLDAKR